MAVDPLTLTDLIGAWRRRWHLLAGGLLIGALVATAVPLAMADTYRAVTVVQVESAEPDLVDMAAEEAVATSRRVTSEALDALGDDTVTIEGLEASTSARTIGSSRVLHVVFTAPTASAAARGADALAQAYLAARAVDAAAADDVSTTRPTGRIVDPARVPRSPTGPAPATWVLAGSVLGLALAAPVAARAPSRRREGRMREDRAS